MMRNLRSRPDKAVVVHAGARDAYQLALGMEEAGLLEALVTDLFWPAGAGVRDRLMHRVAPGLHGMLLRRSEAALPLARVRMAAVAGLRSLMLEKMGATPFAWRRWSTRAGDAELGRKAGRLARRKGAGLVSYSYTGFDAIRAYGLPAMLFQVHPHPATVRRLLQRELEEHPECAASLQQEWELSLPEEDFAHLVAETTMAERYLAASSFTQASLVEHGVAGEMVAVVPYGVDAGRFAPREAGERGATGRLELLFVGRINQRKGIKYLIDAMRAVDSDNVHLTVCGRVVDDLSLFKPLGERVTIRPSVSEAELAEAYRRADLFVFPSVAEGFAQVLLEALASGLPILSTTHTAAPDLIREGVEGFVVAPRDVGALVEKIEWAAGHRAELAEMGAAARRRAAEFTWARFRARAADAVRSYLNEVAERS